jgi:hypothetical protein
MTLFCRSFEILRINVSPIDNDQIVKTPCYVELAVLIHESQIACPQKCPLFTVNGAKKGVLGFLGLVPISSRNTSAGYPHLTNIEHGNAPPSIRIYNSDQPVTESPPTPNPFFGFSSFD